MTTERLAWTLLHFLWQGLAVAVIYAAARAAVRRPEARYLISCLALGAMLLAPAITWLAMSPPAAVVTYRAVSANPERPQTPAPTPATAVWNITAEHPPQVFSWVVMLWLAGAVVFWARLAGGWLVAGRMRSRQIRRAPPEWQESLSLLGQRIGVTRPVQLLVSALVPAPAVVGWWKPVVLVPVGALAGLPAAQMEVLLLHELAHIRRHDYLVNLLQSVAEALLFYHPAVWWISGRIRVEREWCCDDVAVSATGDAYSYARALAQLESCRPAQWSPALGAQGGRLAHRVARLLGEPQSIDRSGSVVAVASLLLVAAYGLWAQSDARPAFDIASVKPSPPISGDPTHQPMGVGYRPGGRMVAANASLMLLIQFAYANHDAAHWLPLPSGQVVGGPSWIETPGYDIEAKAESSTDPRRAWLMMQTLLADRFQLQLHKETRQLPVYELVVSKGGPKLTPAKETGCVSFAPGEAPHQVPGKVDCGYVSGPFFAGPGQLQIMGRKVHTSDLVRELTSVLGRPVVDKTGYTGDFDLRLNFTASDALLGVGGLPPRGDSDLPEIFTALEEQLGLKLVSAKGPVEVLVVDHAERPSAN